MISVVICTYNRSTSLKQTLLSIADMKFPTPFDWELVVVDNNSTDDTKAVVVAFQRDFRLNVRYVFEGNQGLNHARNAGVRAARGDVLAFTDDDVTMDPFWLSNLKAAFDASPCLGVGGRIVPVWSCEKPSWFQTDGPHGLMNVIVRYELGDVARICDETTPPIGANMAFRKSAFERYGEFDPNLDRVGRKLIAGGDTAFGRKLMRANEVLVYSPQAVVFHPVEPHRVTRHYFQSWYFDYGRSQIRLGDLPPNIVRYFGVPRFLLRALTVNLLRWVSSFDVKRRAYYRFSTYQIAGQIAEARVHRRQ